MTLLLGFGVMLFGGGFLARHIQAIGRLKQDPELRARDAAYLVGQQRRRIVTSVMIMVVGALIPLSYDAIVRQRNPGLASAVLLTILVLILVIMLLAVADALAGRYLRADLQLRKAEAALRRTLLENDLQYHANWKQQQEQKLQASGQEASSNRKPGQTSEEN